MPAERPLSIAYLCDYSPLDANTYSGGNARIYAALRKHAGEVTLLDPGWHAAQPIRRLIEALPTGANLRLRWRLHLALARLIARGVLTEMEKGRHDVLFGAYALHALASVRVPPGAICVFTSDAVQSVYRASEVGARFGRQLPGAALLDGWVERRERAILNSLDLALWPSRWLKDAVEARYGLLAERARLIEWGANIAHVKTPPPRRMEPDTPIELLLIGRDWHAKGGPLAVEILRLLQSRGLRARLSVIGCTPPSDVLDPSVRVHPGLDKSIPEERALFEAALSRAHWLVQPSYESYGFAFCEASAYGLPSLCLRVGGVPIRDGVNGYALPPGSPASAFADKIAAFRDDPDAYVALSHSARQEYETRLNWDAWGERTHDALRDALTRKARAAR